MSILATRRQALLNCAAWNDEKAAKATKAKDQARADRLTQQAERLREQAEEG